MISTVAKIIYEALTSSADISQFKPHDSTASVHAPINKADDQDVEIENKVRNDSTSSTSSDGNIFLLPISWLDRANSLHGGSYSPAQVESVKYVLKLAPFLLVMIPYWGIYSQTKTAFQIQGCQMNSEMGGGFSLPISAMNIFNNIAILCLVPLFDQVKERKGRKKEKEGGGKK